MKTAHMTARLVCVLPLLFGAACADRETTEDTRAAVNPSQEETAEETADISPEQVALQKPDPRGTYGAGLVLKETTALQTILAQPEDYENRIVQVHATVDAVCPRRGCWIDIADAGATVRVKVTDGDIVFPLSAKGHKAVVEGIVERIVMTEEEHRAWKEHEAEELGVSFDPATVSGPMTTWRLQGIGARIEG